MVVRVVREHVFTGAFISEMIYIPGNDTHRRCGYGYADILWPSACQILILLNVYKNDEAHTDLYRSEERMHESADCICFLPQTGKKETTQLVIPDPYIDKRAEKEQEDGI
ncbi:hypothetical protein TNIN_91411 [Trichonephila inaurata madagascariensis]|uniref:Uncharacterized protein n=1 Tax=Trichonephila inaurata madagascariensis TaxID=2747483 RepID=A0A8X6YTL0_9ARAC|nr:hypothetical protein TNIN_91411 [Trichonephila inaurata madagascariensis]